MKKLLYFACALMLIMSCNKKATSTLETDNTPKTDSVVDSLQIHQGKQDIFAKIKIVVPVGNEALTRSINHMIKTAIEANDSIDSTSIKAMARFFVETKVNEMKEDADYEGDEPEGPGLWHDMEIKVLYENDQIITMGVIQDVYLAGAHGSALFEGVTFNKADGKVLGKNILAQDKLGEVRKAVTQKLEEYLKDTMGSDYNEAESPLKDETGKEATVELPEKGIYIDNDSVVFVYQQYEILPYAFGLPEASLSLKDMKKNGWLEAEFAKTVKP